ncbi:SpoIIE family protein phosphatase [Streptomyces sp. B1866]|uniref:SpoIIE family protein phosphatase n=1 Tax=Streptomyces sp. B1866 TaxID=3075431 RepID=UPI00288D06EE|nr:SpoIIE family protein phosphatase [Streptomyces sp. B1866]MDT3396219.1 SpoIIE family protein phosphatase [Streptomyces sp. B1866]
MLAQRLAMLAAVDADENDTEVLSHALLHATAGLGGLGGMAHMRLRDITGGLILMASTGLTRPFTRLWDHLSDEDSVAPIRAARENGPVYVPALAVPKRSHGHAADAPRGPAGAGMVALPLPGPEGPLGTLAVLLPESHAPDHGQQRFLAEVARWAGGLLRLAPASPGGVSPTLLHGRRQPVPPQTPPGEEVGHWDWDLRTGAHTIDERSLDVLGIDREAFDGTVESWSALIHPEDLPWATAEAERAVRTRSTYDMEFRLRRADGTYGWLWTRGRVVTGEHGEPVRMVGTVWSTAESHEGLEAVGRALLHMNDGFVSMTGEGRIGFVNAAAERLLGPAREMIGRPLWEVAALRGVPGVAEQCRRAVDEGEEVGFEVPGPGHDVWYHLRLVPIPGGLTAYVTDVTERRAAARRATLMAELTQALAEAVTAQDVVDAVAGSVLPPLGATGLIMATLEHDRLDVVGSVGYPEAFVRRVHGTPLAAAVTGEALRARTPEFSSSPEEFTACHPRAAGLIPAGGKQAAAFLPLIASGRVIGVCVIAYDGPHPFGEDARSLITALSGVVAQAWERAGLYDAATARARELQRALLPRALPSLPALSAAARYLPTAQGADIGGDWYDVIPLSADRVALVIGDVMGHGMPEAATMGRLRTAVRTLSDLELPPDEVLARVNDLVSELGEESFTTCLYGIYDPTTQSLTYTDAGHPPPAVALPDGMVCFPAFDPDPPLGVADPPFETHEVSLPDGSLLVFYTDGLVEVPGRDIEEGMNRLTRTLTTALADGGGQSVRAGGHPAGQAPDEAPERLCDTVTGALLPTDRPAPDDTALLIARTRALAPEDIALWPLPDDPVAAAQARKYVREQLEAWHLSEDLETTTELIVSELVGNVIRHATGPATLRLLRSRTLICEVTDGSLTTPHIRHPSVTDEGGRGLQLVAAMTTRWGTRYTPTGKCIWTEQTIP